jgi:hypothetical protein
MQKARQKAISKALNKVRTQGTAVLYCSVGSSQLIIKSTESRVQSRGASRPRWAAHRYLTLPEFLSEIHCSGTEHRTMVFKKNGH